MYRYALAPRWIASHLFVLFVVVLFINLGLWQLRRHDERADRNAVVAARIAQDPVPVGALASPPDGVDAIQFRPVSLTGTWGPRDLLVDNRSSGGLPGVWVLRVLETPTGSVVVNRGFAGFVNGEVPDLEPVAAGADVLGRVEPWQGSCGVRGDGQIEGMACLNEDAARQAFDMPEGFAVPFVVHAVNTDPSDPDLVPVPLPELDAGPHRSYAGQWFVFATIVAVVYGLILRKVARERAGLQIGAPEQADPDGASTAPSDGAGAGR